MQVAIVRSSELGDRWDPAFHVMRTRLASRARHLADRMSSDEAIERIRGLPQLATRTLSPFLIGKPVRGAQARDRVDAFANQHPFLALAIVEEGADEERRLVDDEIAAMMARKGRLEDLIDACDQAQPTP